MDQEKAGGLISSWVQELLILLTVCSKFNTLLLKLKTLPGEAMFSLDVEGS
jgi:hypothetical protein